jgi:5-methylcytosine-specific restriction enzyme subunit McrC
MAIPIRNLYYLFTYAWGRFPAGRPVDTGVDECPDVPNLFARLLIDWGNRLLRRGLDRGYVGYTEETRSPRGRMLLDDIVKQQSLRRGTVFCAVDELTPDVPHNQIIRATAIVLSRAENIEPSYAHELALLARRMGDVSDARLSASLFRRVQLSRNTGQYLPIVKLCELVFRSMMPDQNGGSSRFADIVEDEVLMSTVFEEFLRNFYAREQEEYDVRREILSWGALPFEPQSAGFVPTMETDITMMSAETAIVFDAKFYREALVEYHGLRRVRSGHLYQLFAYLEHTARRHPDLRVHGGLIYPQSGEPRHLRYRMGDYNVAIWTIDLNQPWQRIHNELLSLPSMIAAHGAPAGS